MTFDEFAKYQDDIWDQLNKIASSKGREYAGTADRLANFKRLGARFDVPPELICMIYGTKHIDSLDTIIKDIMKTGELPAKPSEPIQSRIEDATLYMVLLGALLKERQDKVKLPLL